MNKPKIGALIPFGGYDWRVLDVQGDKALIITEDMVEQRQYHKEYAEITWETCDLREYLNGEFLSKLDNSRIVPQTVQNTDNLWYGTNGGNDTKDMIFLLSLEEADRYFGNSGEYLGKIRKKYCNENVYVFPKMKDSVCQTATIQSVWQSIMPQVTCGGFGRPELILSTPPMFMQVALLVWLGFLSTMRKSTLTMMTTRFTSMAAFALRCG
jgi:hypothetical protein